MDDSSINDHNGRLTCHLCCLCGLWFWYLASRYILHSQYSRQYDTLLLDYESMKCQIPFLIISKSCPQKILLLSNNVLSRFATMHIVKHPAGISVNSVNYALCGKFYLLHYYVSQWEFQISHCFNSTIIFIQNILL